MSRIIGILYVQIAKKFRNLVVTVDIPNSFESIMKKVLGALHKADALRDGNRLEGKETEIAKESSLGSLGMLEILPQGVVFQVSICN